MSDEINASILADDDRLIADLESLYKDLHAHPELSMQEKRTASIAADRLRTAGCMAENADACLPTGRRTGRGRSGDD